MIHWFVGCESLLADVQGLTFTNFKIRNVYKQISADLMGAAGVDISVSSDFGLELIIHTADASFFHCVFFKLICITNSLYVPKLIKRLTWITIQTLLQWILIFHPDKILRPGVRSDCFSDHSVVCCVREIKQPKFAIKTCQKQDSAMDWIWIYLSMIWSLLTGADTSWDLMWKKASVFSMLS